MDPGHVRLSPARLAGLGGSFRAQQGYIDAPRARLHALSRPLSRHRAITGTPSQSIKLRWLSLDAIIALALTGERDGAAVSGGQARLLPRQGPRHSPQAAEALELAGEPIAT